jgi:hypothetical protein
MKTPKTLLFAVAAGAATILLAFSAQALPAALAGSSMAEHAPSRIEAPFVEAKWKQKHGKVRGKHWNRGNHYGWSRGRGHKYGLRKQGRYAY